MKNGYYILLQKLENFIKRYYYFQIIKGLLLSLSLIFIFTTTESIIEYYNYTSIFFRTFLFYTSLIFFISVFSYFIVLPVLKLFHFGKRLTFKQASSIISKHFADVNDNLINTLELGRDIKKNFNDTDLLLASIEQRTNLLNPLPFKIAVSFATIKRSFVYFGISTFIIIIILSFTPNIFKEGTYRIIDHDRYYEPKAPFSFVINNSEFKIKKGQDFYLELLIEGDYIPNDVFVVIGNNSFLMNKSKNLNNKFDFTIKNLNNSVDIHFTADSYISKIYSIKVLPGPILKGFIINVLPPKYTGFKKNSISNSGDINVPFGSSVNWVFNTLFVDSISMFFSNDTVNCFKNEDSFKYGTQILKPGNYVISMFNKNFIDVDRFTYRINVIPDIFPQLDISSVSDSVINSAFYYMINLKDDYGFHKLFFNYRLVHQRNPSGKFVRKSLDFNKNSRLQDVFFYYDFNSLYEDEDNLFIEYYFEVFDNDYISGYKSTKSPIKVFKFISLLDRKNDLNKHEKNTLNSIDDSKKLLDDIQSEMEKFKEKEINNKLSDWDRKNFIKNITNKQKELDKLLYKIKSENNKKNNLNNQLYKESQEILDKQKEIQSILDQIMDEELKQLLKELEELRNKLDPQKFDKLKDKIDLSYKDLNDNLEKSLELLKRFQIEEKISNISEDLHKLSERQESLSEEDYKKGDIEDQIVKQKSINNSLKSIQKDFKETIEKNSDLKRPFRIDKFDNDFKELNEKLNNIDNEINKKSSKKINKQRKESSKSMKNLSKKMQDMLQQMQGQSLSMNMEDLRQIIENLNSFSFNQEELYSELGKTYSNDPKFVTLIQTQNKLNSDFKMIKDSLSALAGRIPQMNQMISKESNDLQFALDKSLMEFEARHRRATIRYQRNVINSSNILALYLEELNDQLQNQMSQSSSGKGKNQQQNKSMKNLKNQQENIKKQLQQLLNELKNQKGNKEGKNLDKGVVKSLAEQEILNKMLQDLQNTEGISPETSNKLKEIKRLSDQNIEDLINKNITQELLKRNETIKTRLLEAENSEREREKEKTRESEEGKRIDRKFPKEIEDFLNRNKNYKESLQKNNLYLKDYYKNLSKEYYNRIK